MNRFRPTCEPLECRLNPAGTVTGSFANGTWTLIGDADANDILINAGPEHNSFFVAGQNGTAVGGVVKADKVKNIVIKLGEGNDRARFNDTIDQTLRLRGHLKFVGGNGANDLVIERMDVGKNLTVTNGEGFDYLGLGNSRVRGHVVVHNGQGDSELDIYRSNVDEFSSIGGNLVIRNGSGADYIQVTDTHIGGSVNVNNGLADVNQDAGAVQIFNLANTVTPSIIRGNVSVTYAGGEVNYEGIWDTEVLGNVTYNYGAAQGEVHFNAFHVLQPVHIHGNLTITGQGDTFVDIGVEGTQTGLIVDGNLIIRTGDGVDLIQTYLLHVGGKTVINTGAGGDKIVIDDSTFAGPVNIQTGTGADAVFVESWDITQYATQFAGALNVNLGDGDDLFSIGLENDPTAAMAMLGGGSWNGGAGTDTLEWRNPDIIFSFPAIEFFEVLPD
jgi:hypothetical protein